MKNKIRKFRWGSVLKIRDFVKVVNSPVKFFTLSVNIAHCTREFSVEVRYLKPNNANEIFQCVSHIRFENVCINSHPVIAGGLSASINNTNLNCNTIQPFSPSYCSRFA